MKIGMQNLVYIYFKKYDILNNIIRYDVFLFRNMKIRSLN